MGRGGYAKIRLAVLGVVGIVAIVAAIGLGLGLGLGPAKGAPPADDPKETGPNGVASTAKSPQATTIDGEVEIPLEGEFSAQGTYRYAGVASDAKVCSTIGTDVLAREGGSAVDAAIATLLCVGVCNMHSTGIGGGHFMTVYIKENKTAYSFSAREVAPLAATEDMYVNSFYSASTLGGLSIGVPGEISGMFAAHQKFGRVKWKKLFEPTIRLCEEGVPVYRALYAAIESTKARDYWKDIPKLQELLTNPETNETYKIGEKMKRPKLAETLRIIAEEGSDAFYNGSLTKNITLDLQEAGSIITEEDLGKYTVREESPVSYKMRDGLTLYSPRPPSSGLIISYILNILDGYNMTRADLADVESTVLTYHRIIEAFKFAYAKRTSLGDELFLNHISELIENLTSSDMGDSIRARITDNVTHNYTYYEPVFAEQIDPMGTAHLSIISANGDAVSVTSTINLYFGSKVVGSRTGIVFNNEMDDFSTPGKDNAFKLPPSPANFIRPGKRPLSSMSPSIFVDKDGEVKLVAGASGGSQITTTVAWVAMQALWFGEDMQKAIDKPRIHHQLVPEYVRCDNGIPQAVLDGLRAKGHDVQERQVTSVCQGVLRQGNHLNACSDRRKGGVPDGY